MQYTQIPANTFKNIQLNAGILVDEFTPAIGVIGNILGATSGGISFNADSEFIDFGADIDNCPKNTKEMKKKNGTTAVLSGSFATVTPSLGKKLAGGADIDSQDTTHIVPRVDLESTDFEDLWWVGDYSDKNDGSTAGFCAIHMMNSLSTGGFHIQTTDKEKGKFSFEFTAHGSISDPDVVPFEVYIKEGESTVEPSVRLNTHSVTIADNEDVTLRASVVPSGTTVTWNSANTSVASVSSGVVTGEGEGNTIVSASITVDGVTYNDTCTVIVTP